MKQFVRIPGVILSAVVFLFMAVGIGDAQTKPCIRGYIGNWEVNQNDNGPMPISKINFKGLTILDWMAISPSTTSPFFATGWEYSGSIQKIIAAAHAAGVKVICTIGSAATESRFLTATDPTNLPVFVDSLKNFLQTEGFDGLDVDWEPLNASDTTQWKTMIIALRQALPRPQYLLTATSANCYQVLGSMQSYLDQVGLMTYGMGYPAGGYLSDYSSPLYSGGHVEPFDNTTPTNSIDNVVKKYEAVGVPASKILIGCEPGGEYWGGITGPYQPITGVTNFRQDIPYTTIMSTYYKPSLYHWDDTAKAAYLSFDTTDTADDWFLSYDDTTGLKSKLNYVSTTGIGGVMIYEIGMSYYQATGDNPFLDVAQEYLQGQSSTTPTGPTVSISSPSNGTTVSGTINISANVTDNLSITGVTFKVDGNQLGSTLTSAPYSTSENTMGLLNGTHTITATATDAGGNTATSSTTVTVSNAQPGPTVSISSPANGTTVSGTINISANVTDNLSITGVEFRVDSTQVGNTLTDPPYSDSVNTTTLSNGTHTVSATATDAGGKSATSSVTVTVNNVPPGPTISITSPAAGDTVYGTITISADVTDKMHITGVVFRIDSSQIGDTVTTAPFSISENATLLSNGSHTIKATAIDSGGYSATSSITVTVHNTPPPPPAPPKVAITSPSNGATVSGTITLSAVASDSIGVSSVYFKCGSYKVGNDVTTPPYKVSFNTDSASNGSHTILAIACDSSGDTSSASVTINVSNTVSPLPPIDSGLVVYHDSLSTPWMNESYGANIDFTNSSPVDSGSTYSIKVVNNAWGTLYLHDGNWGSGYYVNTSKYSDLTFSVYSTQKISIMVFFENDARQSFPSVTAQAITQGQWSKVSIPVAQLNLGNFKVQDIGIMESSGRKRTYFVDDIAFALADSNSAGQVSNSPTVTMVYGDSLTSPWIDASWSAAVNYSNTSPVFSGIYSAAVTASAWGALSMHYGTWGSGTLNPADYDTLQFEVYAPSSATIDVNLEDDNGSTFPKVSLGSIPANQWIPVSVAMSNLDPSNSNFTRIDIMNYSASTVTYYVDDIRLLHSLTAGNEAVTGIQNSASQMPKTFALEQNYPNPFNPSTTISFLLPKESHVALRIYNILGEEVATLANGVYQAGAHEIAWNPESIASGIYICQLQTEKGSISKRMVYLK